MSWKIPEVSNYQTKIRIGSSLEAAPLGLGAWSWGDRLSWSYGETHTLQDVQEAYKASVDAGIKLIDTAEGYGFGQSERILGSLVQPHENKLLICSKFFPYPWRLTRTSLKKALKGSLKRLGLPQIDLYLIHWPTPPVAIEVWMQAMGESVLAGMIEEVGVSNFNKRQMRRAQEALSKYGLRLAANQVLYNLIHRNPERNGILETCREDQIMLLAYSPLAQGMLTGKYSPGGPRPKGRMRARYRSILGSLRPLVSKLQAIGEAHGGKTPAQVALNWTLSRGVLPIPGAKNRAQAVENAQALGWELTDQEIFELNQASDLFHQTQKTR